jgi:GDPmannose 4,6-dehydratase
MPTKSTALITGIFGQDGRLLAERLLDSGYRVVGVVKPQRDPSHHGFMAQVHSVAMDLADPHAVLSLLEDWQPDEIYHLAAAHHSSQEHQDAAGLATNEAMLSHNFLSTRTLAFAMLQLQSKAHLVFAASSQMYTPLSPNHAISEDSRRSPGTFYGFTKSWSMDLLAFLRTKHGLHASTAILFNHESPLRNPQFVSRKITQAAARAKSGMNVKLELLNIGARVDWSSAHDVVRALHLMANAERGGDYIVASSNLHSVRDLLEIAFGHVGLDWRNYTSYKFDSEEPALIGQAQLLRDTFKWQPSIGFKEMIVAMVEHDRQLLTATASD